MQKSQSIGLSNLRGTRGGLIRNKYRIEQGNLEPIEIERREA